MFWLTVQRASGGRTAAVIGAIVVLNLVFSFLFQWYILATIGPGAATDGLVASMVVPQFVLAVVSGPLLNVVVPVLASETPEQARADVWTLLHTIGGAALVLAALLAASAGLWVPIVVPGFGEATIELTVRMTRILAASIVFHLLTMVAWCAYRAQGRFVQLELHTLVGNVGGFIALVFVVPRLGIVGAAWVMTARALLQLALLVRGLGAYDRPDWRSSAIREAWRRSMPMLGGAMFYKVTLLTDRAFASFAPASGLSLFNLGQQLYGSAEQLIAKSVVAPVVPRMARLVTAGDLPSFRQTYWRRFVQITALMVAGFVLLGFVGEPALDLLVGHGNFSDKDVRLLWLLLLALGGQLIISPAASILNAAFYTSGETVIPTVIGAAATVVGIGLRFTGLQLFGIVGLALGVSAQYLLALVVLLATIVRYRFDQRIRSDCRG